MNRCFVVIASVALAGGLYGQPKGGPVTVTGDLKQNYNQIKNLINRAADEMPDAGYSSRPTPEEFTFGGWVAHVADTQAAVCGAVTGNIKQLGAGQKTSKADLMAALKDSFDICDAVYDGTTDANANDLVMTFRGQTPRVSWLHFNIAHDNECYGSMAVYLRLQKLVPPSSQGRGGAGKGGGKKQ